VRACGPYAKYNENLKESPKQISHTIKARREKKRNRGKERERESDFQVEEETTTGIQFDYNRVHTVGGTHWRLLAKTMKIISRSMRHTATPTIALSRRRPQCKQTTLKMNCPILIVITLGWLLHAQCYHTDVDAAISNRGK